MILSHFSSKPFKFDPTTKYSFDDEWKCSHSKPVGLWLSDETDYGWKKWCKSEEFGLERLKRETKFKVKGNQGVFAERCFYPDGTIKVAPELSPYAKDLPGMERYVAELNKKLGKELGQTLKIKKFLALESFN